MPLRSWPCLPLWTDGGAAETARSPVAMLRAIESRQVYTQVSFRRRLAAAVLSLLVVGIGSALAQEPAKLAPQEKPAASTIEQKERAPDGKATAAPPQQLGFELLPAMNEIRDGDSGRACQG